MLVMKETKIKRKSFLDLNSNCNSDSDFISGSVFDFVNYSDFDLDLDTKSSL